MKSFNLHFLGVGPQRTGTSWLHYVLTHHPELCFPSGVKETRFFDLYFGKGNQWFESHYIHRENHQLCGEIASTYLDADGVSERVQKYYPNCKIIINVRNPVSRALSAYNHYRKLGAVNLPLFEAAHKIPTIIDAGQYSKHIPQWAKIFGAENVKLVLLDDIEKQPQNIIDDICNFLNIGKLSLVDDMQNRVAEGKSPRNRILSRAAYTAAASFRKYRLHRLVELGKHLGFKSIVLKKTLSQPSLSESEKSRLLEIYDKDILYIESMLNRDLSAWKN